MKKILLLVAVVAASFSLKAQIPNASFDMWSVQNGDTVIGGGWTGNGERVYTAITLVGQGGATVTRNPSEGTHFLGLNNTQAGQVVTLGSQSNGFALTDRPVSFSADIMHFPQAQERFAVAITLKKGADTVANNIAVFAQTVTNWSSLTMNFVYRNQDDPDSCFITFVMLGNANGQASANTSLFLDNMRFNTFGVSVPEIDVRNISAVKAYPNPATNNTTLSFNLEQSSDVEVELYDMNGKRVITLMNNLPQGENEVNLNIANLKSGLYIYKVKSEQQVINGKLSIVK